ncbi:MAG: alpha/beta hydrolase [Pseudomonadota bacterium]
MATRLARIGGVDIAYRIDGPDETEAVVMGHCFGADHRFWDPHLPAASGFRVIRFDMRGHGQSSLGDGISFPALAGDVAGLLDNLEIERAHYVGVSMGGMVGQVLASWHPDRLRSLTLVNTAPKYPDPQQRLWRQRAAEVAESGIAPLKDALLSRWFTDAAAEAGAPGHEGYLYMAACIDAFAPATFIAASEALAALDTTSLLGAIDTPTLVVAAPEDPGVPTEMSELLAASINGARLEWLHPARHLASLEHVDRFNTLLGAHLATHKEGT